jgi:calcium-dependent protein kinase
VADQLLVAIKVLSKQNINLEKKAEIEAEIECLRKLDHPNIVKYYETYENDKYFYIVMEYCSGGELFTRITEITKRDGHFCEKESAKIVFKILKAIAHCHANNIAHRDLKPENIMLTDNNNELKIIDFGVAKKSKQISELETIVGTPYYLAPEVLQGDYGYECDCWSIGVILYVLLSGYLPFMGINAKEVFERIKIGEYSFA